jgi:GT2 family glycosyltransferase
VLAVLVCHDGQRWLAAVLSALRELTPRPAHVLAVDTGSTDGTTSLLAESDVLDGVLTLGRDVGFGAAVRAAVDEAVTRWGDDPGRWIWLLHDDSAPEPDCLGVLLTAAELSPSVGVLGPLAVDWADPRLVVEAGLSTDAAGNRQTGIGPTELDWGRYGGSTTRTRFEQNTDVLAVGSAGALIRWDGWRELGGFDPALPMLWDDIDFGWRANRAGRLVLCVPSARLRHARAVSRGLRTADALAPFPGPSVRAVDRSHALRTLLVHGGRTAIWLGLPRLVVLGLLRCLGFAVLRRFDAAHAELRALRYLLAGRAGLRSARATARESGTTPVRGLLTTRLTRLRNLLHGGVVGWVRRRVAADAVLGELPADEAGRRLASADSAARRPVGPAALPAGALRRSVRRGPAGLRRPATTVVVPLAEQDVEPARPPLRGRRPSPTPRGVTARAPELVVVDVAMIRIVRQLLLAPPVLLVVLLTAIGLAINASRMGDHLAGGGLLPASGLSETWSGYLASWHPAGGGTIAPAPPTLAVLGVLGAVLSPFGGPPAALAVLLLGDVPLAGVLAYLATRRLPVRRWVRALAAAGYALLPIATDAVGQGRLDVIVVHLLLPGVLAGTIAVVDPGVVGAQQVRLSSAAGVALGLAVIGAFEPLVQLIMVLFALAGFVFVPGGAEGGRRRIVGLFVIVLLPLVLLVPWPAVLVEHPAILWSGVGAAAGPQPANTMGLDLLLPAAVIIGLTVRSASRPARLARLSLPGLGVVVLGGVGVGLLISQRQWAGAPMIVVGAGLLWVLLAACRTDLGPRRALQLSTVAIRTLAGLGVAAVLVLAGSDLILGRTGPLRTDEGGLQLAEPVSAELADTGRSVLVLAADGQPTRQAAGRMPGFGDDDLLPATGSATRLSTWDYRLRSADASTVRATLAHAVAAGVVLVVLPNQAVADRLRAEAGELVSVLPPTSDGRPVLRINLTGGTATLISAALAKNAVTGGSPPTAPNPIGVAPVSAAPPNVAVRVSEGGDGRLLVLAAEDENGWQATVDGQPAPIVRAWGHLVSVAVPIQAVDVRIWVPGTTRYLLLLVQAAVLLFTALTAVPARRGANGVSST